MPKINVLSFAVANLIAAGEVVDRPSSVVKELLENAIDAGADKITVEIQRGGVTFIRVTDNGCGMTAEDMPVAIRRHATSKIREAEDLESIMTLGFRGEALAAISAVSRIRIFSRTADAEMGNILEAEGGNVLRIAEQGCAKGTTVIVEELFANVPARRKFLKKDAAETMAVAAIVERVALSHPEIAFSMIADGAHRFDTAGDGSLEHAIHAVFGRDFARRMIRAEASLGGITVEGYIGRSDNVKANRNYQNFFINGRYVRSKTAAAALEQAYTSFIAPERFPVCVLNITLNPGAVDVNVHPAKLEVKFSNEKPVFEAVYTAVRGALTRDESRPELILREAVKRQPSPPPRSFLPLEDRAPGEKKQPRQLTVDTQIPRAEPETVKPKGAEPFARMSADEYRATFALPPRKGVETPVPPAPRPVSVPEPVPLPEPPPPMPDQVPMPDPPVPVPEPSVLLPEPPPIEEKPLLPQYRIVGEVFNCYILVERGDTMLLIDKHAAHERILFEDFRAKIRAVEGAAQLLLTPIRLELTGEECGALEEYRREIEGVGYAYTVEGNRVEITQIPNGISTRIAPDMLGLLAAQILCDRGDVRLTHELLFERALYQASCKSAIKGGRLYDEGHIAWLVERLLSLPDITVCPHGRPVAIEMTHRALDRQFARE